MPAEEPSWPEDPGKGGGSHVAFPLTPPMQPAGRGHAPSCQDPSHLPCPGSWVGLLPAVTSLHPRAGFLRVSGGWLRPGLRMPISSCFLTLYPLHR